MFQDITINRLNIQSTKRDVADVVFGLENESWSGYVEPGEWLFVRRLSVHGRKNELPRMAGGALQYAVSVAVDGGSAQASDANAVKFRSLPGMLTFLLRDLFNDNFVNKWYWQNWRYLNRDTRANAVARLLWENVAYLPAIVESLIEHRLLARVWQQLSHQSAGEIARQFESESPAGEVRMSSRTADIPRPELERLLASQLESISPRLNAWNDALQGVPMLDNRSRLAFTLIAKAVFPRLWAQHAEIIEQVIYQSIHRQAPLNDTVRATQPSSSETPVAGPDRRKSTDMGSISDSRDGFQHLVPDATTNAADITDVADEGAAEIRYGEARQTPISILDPNNRESSFDRSFEAGQKSSQQVDDGNDNVKDTRLNTAGTEPDSARDEIQHGALVENSFFTAYGGLFYLVNSLSTERYQQLLQKDDITRSGWLWLFDLARRLTPALDKPMLEFVAAASGYDRVDDLLQMPPLAVVNRLESKLATELAELGLWDDKLLSVPARVIATASHIDCFYPLECVRLEVRLAGLDINPGWVPWLGRVVTFHYGETSDAVPST